VPEAVQTPAGPPIPTPGWLRWFLIAALSTLILDLVSKQILFALPPGTDLPGFLRLVYNPGVAWSLFSEHPWLVLGLTMTMIPVLVWVWWTSYRHEGRWANAAFGMVLGGAIGNLVDRIGARLGLVEGVRDFVHVDLGFPPFDPWPTFNIADSGICVGFALLIFLPLLATRSKA
jgi:signal peptidase II